MNVNYNKCKEMSDFWKEIRGILGNCMNYMCNDSDSEDREYVDIVCGLLISVQNLCDHRAKVLAEKCEALESLAGGME